jgi:hypothetical protein
MGTFLGSRSLTFGTIRLLRNARLPQIRDTDQETRFDGFSSGKMWFIPGRRPKTGDFLEFCDFAGKIGKNRSFWRHEHPIALREGTLVTPGFVRRGSRSRFNSRLDEKRARRSAARGVSVRDLGRWSVSTRYTALGGAIVPRLSMLRISLGNAVKPLTLADSSDTIEGTGEWELGWLSGQIRRQRRALESA